MTQSLNRDDIIRGLRELADDLINRGVSAEIFIIGGAALALRYFDRRLTSDVDLRSMDFDLIRPLRRGCC
jgi:predicted nucleotidyltransferase